jgi:hypothetical protein
MLQESILPSHLSAAQHEFALENGAVPVRRSDVDGRSIFMYRHVGRRTHRWLVDEHGRTVESASFQR